MLKNVPKCVQNLRIGDSDVICSYQLFSAILWGKLCEMFVVLTSVRYKSLSQWDSDSMDIFLNQLIQFYSNNETNLHHLTTHGMTCWPTKWRSHCDHRSDVTSPYVYLLISWLVHRLFIYLFTRWSQSRINIWLSKMYVNTASSYFGGIDFSLKTATDFRGIDYLYDNYSVRSAIWSYDMWNWWRQILCYRLLWSSTVDQRLLGQEVSGLKWRRWRTVANRQATSQLVTRSTRHKRAHNKATSRNFFLLHASQIAPWNSAQHGRRTYGKQAYNKTYAIPCSSVWLFGFNVCNVKVTDDGEALECDEC